jgi:hypothetical protein
LCTVSCIHDTRARQDLFIGTRWLDWIVERLFLASRRLASGVTKIGIYGLSPYQIRRLSGAAKSKVPDTGVFGEALHCYSQLP